MTRSPLATAEDILEDLRTRGVTAQAVGDRLRLAGPAGAIDDELRAAVARHKADVLALLSNMPASIADIPLTAAQHGIWLFQAIEEDAATYNLAVTLRLDGPLDVARLELAISTVIARNLPLHSTYRASDGGAVMRPQPGRKLSLPVEDLSMLEESDRYARWTERQQTFQNKPFDLAAELPVRAHLVRTSEKCHDLMLAMHHVAVDGASTNLFVQELATAYAGKSLPPTTLTFADYARRERAYWTPERVASRAEFWQKELDGAPTAHDVPADRVRPARATYRGAAHHARINHRVTERIQHFAHSERASLFMVVHAALVETLYRHGGQRDVVIGSPFLGRDEPSLATLIGMFVHQLPLRLRRPPSATLRSLVRDARETLLRCLSELELPFGTIVDAVGAPRDASRNPIFQVLLNVSSAAAAGRTLAAGDLQMTLPSVEERLRQMGGQAKFDLTLYVMPERDGLQVMLVYNADVFESARAAALLDDLVWMLTDVVQNPDERLDACWSRASLTTPVAAQLRAAGMQASAPTVSEVLMQLADECPEAPAILTTSHTIDRRTLQGEVERLSRLLTSGDTGKASGPVGLVVPHDERAVMALIGTLRSGRPYVALDPRYPDARLEQMVREAGIHVILTTGELRERSAAIAGPGGSIVCFEDSPPVGAVLPPFPAPDAPAYLLFTSGSTGGPKAVVQTQRNLLHQAQRYADALRIDGKDRLAWTASLSFDATIMDVVGGLVGGAVISPINVASAGLAAIPALARDRQLTVLHFTPTAFRTLVRTAGDASFPSVRAVVLGGEVVRPVDVEGFDTRFRSDAELFNLYGSSEHSFALGMPLARAHRSLEQPIGWPVGDTEVILLDTDGQPDPVRGELVLRSAQGALGYWDPEAGAPRRFVLDAGDPTRTLYRTGDVVRRRRDGALVFLHRADQQVKVRGHRVEPFEVEQALLAHPAVLETAVHAPIGRDDLETLTACVVAREGSSLPDGSVLSAWCADRLPSYMVPTAWVVLDRLPRTPSGKINRRALPEAAESSPATRTIEAPRDAEEADLLLIWREVLRVDAISVHDDFFRLGGHSLTAMQVIARVRDTLGVELPLRRFFDAPTIAGAAALVRESRVTRDDLPPLVAGQSPDPAPLSFAQERLWFLQQLDPRSTAYNMKGAVLLNGAVDVPRLARALDQVAMAQESLRTRFAHVEGQLAQVVDPAPTHRLEVLDVTDRAEGERHDAAVALATARLSAVYDLEQGPLCRFVLCRLDAERHLFAVGMHHTIGDFWSAGVLDRAIAEAYAAHAAGATPADTGGLVTYRDYAAWQRQWLREGPLERQVGFWRERLAGASTLALPADFARPAFQSFNGDRLALTLEAALLERIRSFASGQRATPFVVLLAAWKILLARYARQEDIVVGVPVAGRRARATEGLVGMFVNTLVHRTDLSGDPSFAEVVQRVRTTALEALAHQDAPFELIVQTLKLPRDTSRSPLFQVMFNVTALADASRERKPWREEAVTLSEHGAPFDLTMMIGLGTSAAEVSLTYNTDLFERATAERWLLEYAALLDTVVAAPGTTVRALQALAPAAREQVLERWNTTNLPLPLQATLPERVAEQAALRPDALAVRATDGTFTYAELLTAAQRVTATLRARGVRPGDRVAVALKRGRMLPAVLLGIHGAGAAYVPVDPNFPAARVQLMLEDSGAVLVVSEPAISEKLGTALPVLDIAAGLTAAGEAFDVPTADTAAYLIYTSGSTGRPKGVEVPHRALANFLLAMREQPGCSAQDVLLAVTTVSFDISVLELFLPLVEGAQVVIASEEEAQDGRKLRDRLADGITMLQATPATWKLLMAAGWSGTPGLRILCGGEALTRSLADDLQARGAEIWNLYGPTETTVWSTVEQVPISGPILVGRPIANTSVYVLDEAMEPVPVGVAGELWIGGQGVATGYHGRADLTAERFVANPFRPAERLYRTGDLARWRADGRLEHLGRADLQLKVRGYRIEPGEIESRLRAMTGVRDAVVTAVADRLVAYVVPAPSAAITTTTMRKALGEHLPAYMVPATFVLLDALPLTANGKVDRKALPAPTAARKTTGDDPRLRDPRTRMMADVWRELLQIEHVQPGDNFFEVGGHSLLAMAVVTKVQALTGHRFDPRALFFRTLHECAQMLPANEESA